MSDIVKYHNDMNSVDFHKFNAVELDLLLSICSKIRDEGLKTVIYNFTQLKKLSNYKPSDNKRFISDLQRVNRKFLALNFTIQKSSKIIQFVLFKKFEIDTGKKTLEISINEEFRYILNELTSHFTRFELDEFVSLQSKYAKNAYRLLKQFRSSGNVYFTIKDFRSKLDIPKSYNIAKINIKVLTPIQEELTPLFNNLKIEKIKDTSKRGHPVTHINFSFTPQKRKKIQKNKVDNYLKQLRDIYLPDFTIEEIETLRQYASDEDLKIVSKQYEEHKKQAEIKNKMGFMIQALKSWNNLKKF